MSIHLHIERLVVDTGLATDPRLLQSGLAEELSRLLGQEPLPGMLHHDGVIRRIHPEKAISGGNPEFLGKQAGRAIFESLSSPRNQEP